MATTTKTVFPIEPAFEYGQSAGAVPLIIMPLAASQTVKKGDAIIFGSAGNAGIAVRSATDTAKDTLIGFAAAAKTTTASVDNEVDQISIYPALPQIIFSGNLVAAAGTDATGAIATDIGVYGNLVVADTDTIFAPAQTTSASVITTLRYARQRDGTMGILSGVGKKNPRVLFICASTVYSRVV